jgi:LysR family hca operon transcriptional activator
MNIEYFKEFVVLAQTLSFQETARRVSVSQPTLTKHIDAMEREFGVELIDRSTRPVKLTEKGMALYSEATSIAESYDRIRQQLRDSGGESSKMYRICSLTDNPRIAGAIGYATRLARDEGVTILCSFVQAPNKTPIRQLRDNDVDIALTFLSPRQEKMHFMRKIKTHQAPFAVVMRSTHRLAGSKGVKYVDLTGETLFHLGGELYRAGWETIESLLNEHGIRYRSKTVLAQSDLDIGSIDVGDGLLILPASNQYQSYFSSGYDIVPLDEPDAVFSCYVVYRNESGDKALDKFVQDLASYLSKHGLSDAPEKD